MLTDHEILKNMQSGEIHISPFETNNLGPNSYDIRIGDKVRSLKFNTAVIDLKYGSQYNFMEQELPYHITPGETILFSSKETLGCCKKTAGLLSPRSNLARSGLGFTMSSLLDTGFFGVISGAMHNFTKATLIIPRDLRVAQIMYIYNDGELEQPYNKRWLSKNTAQFSIEDIKYRPDKEWLNGLCERDNKRE